MADFRGESRTDMREDRHMDDLTQRAVEWAGTMAGHLRGDVVVAHDGPAGRIQTGAVVDRQAREQREAATLRPGAARAHGAGHRAVEEEPDPERTCFERDRDRIVHSTAFRRLAGKTQVVLFPTDHQRTRLTHALEVAQVALSIARGIGANATLAEAIALGHDCGHGPGGHASEDAFEPYIPGGYNHAPWGADIVLAPLNLCAETLDGVRNHSWSRPTPSTIEGEIVSWADRIAYCAHDLEDAVRVGVVTPDDLPPLVAQVAGRTLREQLAAFIRSVITMTTASGMVGMDETTAAALAELRAFDYERIYMRPAAREQADAIVALLRALVDDYVAHPEAIPDGMPDGNPVLRAVTYVAGMTDRFAIDTAVERLGWSRDRLPQYCV